MAIRERVWRWIGVPSCVGMGPTKTLAKLANHIAKSAERKPGSYPAEFAQVCHLGLQPREVLQQLFAATDVGDVWGIGPRISAQLQAQGVHTVEQLLQLPPETVRARWSVVLERTVREWMFRRPLKWVARSRRADLVERLKKFREAGGKTALVSDYPATEKLNALGVANLFDLVVSSGEPGGPSQLKPHPEGYLSAAERLGVAPSACLVIGDRDDADGAAARAAGMAVHIIR